MRVFLFLFWLGPITVFCQQRIPILFTDYGPSAFESFWRPTPTEFQHDWTVSTFSRFSQDRSSNQYFTQYFQLTLPTGNNNHIQVRTPYHFFRLTQDEMQRIDGSEKSGSSWGDLDFLFHFRLLPNTTLLNSRLKLFLSAEMHTAPTNRNQRQFTDTIKMLGSVIAQHAIIQTDQHHLDLGLQFGFGGWQDDIVPRQNHVVKLSSSLAYQRTLGEGFFGLTFGQTYLSGERENDQGWLLSGGVSTAMNKMITTQFSYKKLIYSEQFEKVTNQYELGFLFNLSRP